MTADFQLEGQSFTALNGGPQFHFTPAMSLFVSCTKEKEVDTLWRTLSEGGKVLMELQKYPFSEKYGWLTDRYGLSWQLNLGGRAKRISPFLLFVGKQHGKAEEAIKYYASIFEGSTIDQMERYPAGREEPEGTVMHARFSLAGEELMAMESAGKHDFTFTPAVSLFVSCKTQEEVDELWEKLSAGGQKGQCGWLEDRYGVSWQIIPTVLGELLRSSRSKPVMEAMFKMTKIDIRKLQEASEA
jgi:predicted 3-demethylubiquinone-9 3-methyltransferase (glyoxalase superfamily)